MPWEPEGVVEERLASFSCDDKPQPAQAQASAEAA